MFFSSKKRNRKKKKQEANSEDHEQKEKGDASSAINITIKDIQLAMDTLKIQEKPAKTQEEALQKSYHFWSTQPVPKMGN